MSPVYFVQYVSGMTKKRMNSQASEFFADSHRSKLAEYAGYPQDSMFHALSVLEWGEDPDNDKEIGNALSTHPTNNVRLAAIRTSNTYERFSNGVRNAINTYAWEKSISLS